MKYLDPRNDITFRKIFGGHKNLCISLLNSLLPLPEDEQIESIEYLAPDMLPDSPDYKNSIVDVRCTDTKGRIFLVSVLIYWVKEYFIDFIENDCKGYIQYVKTDELKGYNIFIINNFTICDASYYNTSINYKESIFIQFPNHSNEYRSEMARLWTKFLSIRDNTDRRDMDNELLDNDITNQALDIIEESSLSHTESYAYERVFENISCSRTLFSGARKDGRAEGLEEGRAEGLEEGRKEGILLAARTMIDNGMDVASVAKLLKIAPEDLQKP